MPAVAKIRPSLRQLSLLAACLAGLALLAGCGSNRGVKLDSAAGHSKCEKGARGAGAPADAARAGCDCIVAEATRQGYSHENDIPKARQQQITSDCRNRYNAAQAALSNGPITAQQRADFITGCAGRRQSAAYCGCLLDHLQSNGLNTLAKIADVEQRLKQRKIDPRLRTASVACRSLYRRG